MCKKLVYLVTLVLVLGLTGTTLAEHVNWTGADSNLWSDPCNWDLDPGPPTSTDNAWIDPSAGPNWPVIDYHGAEAMIVWIGDWTEGTAHLTITNGSLDVDEEGPGYGVGVSGYVYVGGGWAQDNQYIAGELHVDGGTIMAGGLSIYSGDSVVEFDPNGTGKIILSGDVVSEMEAYITGGRITGTGVQAYLDESGNTAVQVVAPGYAWDPRPSDGAVHVNPHRVLSWGLPPDVVSPTYDVYLGTDPNFSGESPIAADRTEPNYDPEPDLDYTTQYFWRVDVNDSGGINEGAVWSFTTGGTAYNPSPANTAGNVPYLSVDLGWIPGVDANEHDLYLGIDEAAVAAADITDLSGIYIGRFDSNSYALSCLTADEDYYWRVDEVNDSGLPQWPGDVWWFWTGTHINVDDFDDYASDDALRAVWLDYWSFPDFDTKAEVFLETAPDFVLAGPKSMVLNYVNDQVGADKRKYSEIKALASSLEVGTNWKACDSRALIVPFRGELANSPQPIYIVIEDSDTNVAVVAYDDPNATLTEQWIEWNIDLEDFNSAGVDLANVSKVYLGVGVRGAMTPPDGGTGWVYFDEIELVQSRCLPELVLTDFTGDCITDSYDLAVMARDWLVSDANIVATPPDPGPPARYEFEDNFLNSGTAGSDADGTPYGSAVVYNDATRGKVLLLGGQDGDYVDCNGVRSDIDDPPTWADITGSITVALWAKTDGSIPEGWHGFVNKRSDSVGGEPYMTWSLEGLGNEVRWAFVPAWGTGWGDASDNEIYVDITFDDGEWHHIAAVYDVNSYSAVYIDAVEVGHLDLPDDYGRIFEGTGPLLIGGYGNIFYGENWPGYMDEVRIYDHALSSQAEIVGAMGLSILYQPVPSPANPYNEEPLLQRKVNLNDFAMMADTWLEEDFWP